MQLSVHSHEPGSPSNTCGQVNSDSSMLQATESLELNLIQA